MTSNSNSPEFGGIKTTLPLTAEQIANNWCWDNGYPDHKMAISIASLLKAYAAQKNAELVAENERLKTSVRLFDEQGDRLLNALENKEAENERLKQHNKALIPLAAWSKKHGHELTCSIRKPIPDGVDRVVCNCGWVAAHNHSGLTTNQHIELAKYSDAQPPKEDN